MEHNYPSSCIFLDLPPVSQGDGSEDGDGVLPYISRKLMEERDRRGQVLVLVP